MPESQFFLRFNPLKLPLKRQSCALGPFRRRLRACTHPRTFYVLHLFVYLLTACVVRHCHMIAVPSLTPIFVWKILFVYENLVPMSKHCVYTLPFDCLICDKRLPVLVKAAAGAWCWCKQCWFSNCSEFDVAKGLNSTLKVQGRWQWWLQSHQNHKNLWG